ncbi:hypothetical protein Aab01nite_79200 [Paractinoplanes abujensis]|nr:hypothetical protein Aab01nite_79200 [Actinoplanes abujensis]
MAAGIEPAPRGLRQERRRGFLTALAAISVVALTPIAPAGPAQAAPTPNVDAGFGADGVATVAGKPVDAAVDSSGRTHLLTTDANGITRLTTLTPDGAKERESVLPFAGLLATGADSTTMVVAAAQPGVRVHRVGGATTTALANRTIEVVQAVTVRQNGTLIVHAVDQDTNPSTHLLAALKPDGSLDPSWDTDGLLETTDDIRTIAATGNNLLTATSTNVVRYTAAGTPELALHTLPAGFEPSSMSASFITGRSANRMAIVKILPTGARDAAFGVDGLALGAAHECTPTARRAFATSNGATAIGHNADCGASRVYVQRWTVSGKDAGELVVDQVGTQQARGHSSGGPQSGGRTIVTFASAADATSAVRLFHTTAVPAYSPVASTRLLMPTRVGPHREVTLSIRGTNASAVALDVAVARGQAPGGVLAYPAGTRPPAVVTNVHNAGQSATQRIVVPLTSTGQITLRNASNGSAHLAANLVGWYRTNAYFPVPPTRVLNARGMKARSAISFAVAGRAGVPASARTVLVNLSVNGATSAGSLKLTPAGTAVLASHGPNQPGNATTRVTLGTGGRMTVVNNAPTSANVMVDVIGYLKS